MRAAGIGHAPLLNPANDAKAVSNTLRGMGFTAIDARDASKQQMETAIGQARDALNGRNRAPHAVLRRPWPAA